MKSTYEKPLLAVEYFAMTQSVASCDTKIGSTDTACIVADGDATSQMKDLALGGFFIENCSISASGADENDGICYHTNANAAFKS